MKHTTQKGFTLIELLAVMAIFVTVSFFTTSIIVSVLRGNNKSNAIAAVEANGTYAISQMSKTIRGARALDASVVCGTIDQPVISSSIAVVSPSGAITTFSCTKDSNNNPIIASDGAALTDANSVSVNSCSFSCGENSPSDFPLIGIDFSLQYKSNGLNSFADQTASSSAVEFGTSIIMRNLER